MFQIEVRNPHARQGSDTFAEADQEQHLSTKPQAAAALSKVLNDTEAI